MTSARHLVAVAALGVATAALGFTVAAWLGDAGSEVARARAAGPVASPAEALPPPSVSAAPAETDPAPGPPPPPPDPPAVVEAAPGTVPRPRVEPEPPAAPRPSEAPEPPPGPGPGPRPDAAPPGPPAHATAPPPAPPEGIRIPAGGLPTGWEPARRELVEALRRAEPGSTTEADVRRGLALWKAYLGPDAGATPPGRRATIARALRANAWWYARSGAPERRVLLRDPDGVILTYRAGQGFAVNPVATTGRWRDLNAEVSAPALAEALLPMGVRRRSGGRAFTAWEYHDVAGDPLAILPGASGMAQARVALVMAHALADTGDPRFAEAALGALAALTVDVDRGGTRSMVTTQPGQEPLPWYVERAYPGKDPWTGGALNGFMVTLLDLSGAAALLETDPGGGHAATGAMLARDLADRGERTLERHLDDHDTGTWSLYGLLTPGRPWRSYVADLNYHCYHIRLLTRLADPHPDSGFTETATRWQGYVDAAGVACPERSAPGQPPRVRSWRR